MKEGKEHKGTGKREMMKRKTEEELQRRHKIESDRILYDL